MSETGAEGLYSAELEQLHELLTAARITVRRTEVLPLGYQAVLRLGGRGDSEDARRSVEHRWEAFAEKVTAEEVGAKWGAHFCRQYAREGGVFGYLYNLILSAPDQQTQREALIVSCAALAEVLEPKVPRVRVDSVPLYGGADRNRIKEVRGRFSSRHTQGAGVTSGVKGMGGHSG